MYGGRTPQSLPFFKSTPVSNINTNSISLKHRKAHSNNKRGFLNNLISNLSSKLILQYFSYAINLYSPIILMYKLPFSGQAGIFPKIGCTISPSQMQPSSPCLNTTISKLYFYSIFMNHNRNKVNNISTYSKVFSVITKIQIDDFNAHIFYFL